MFYEIDTIDLILVDLGTELNGLDLFAANNWAKIVFVDTYDTTLWFFSRVEDLVLLPIYFLIVALRL